MSFVCVCEVSYIVGYSLIVVWYVVFFFKQKTAYEMRISDWSSDVCSSDLRMAGGLCLLVKPSGARTWLLRMQKDGRRRDYGLGSAIDVSLAEAREAAIALRRKVREGCYPVAERRKARKVVPNFEKAARDCYEALKERSEEHTSELQ